MTLTLAIAAIAALQASADTTFAVRADARLELRDLRGSIQVEAWDEPRIRVRADYGSRDRLRIEDRGGVITVRTERERGRSIVVDYRITVPRRMAVTLGGQEADVQVAGTQGELRIDLIEGNVVLREIGAANVSTVDGDITVTGAVGALRINTTDGEVTLTSIRGDIFANTLDGDITLDRIEAAQVQASTVDGDVYYDGAIRDGGQYRLSTHDGDVTLVVPRAMNATVSVATFDGDFESTFPVQLRPRNQHGGYRFSFTIGSGSAQVELESFDGAIRLRDR